MRKRDSIFLYIINYPPVKFIIIFFVIWNVLWGMNLFLYTRNLENYTKANGNYYRDTSQYLCTISTPKYLCPTGNYAITNENRLAIIIWPRFLCYDTPEYGIEIPKDENYIYRFYVDENLNYLSVEEMHYSKQEEHEIMILLNLHKTELYNMLDIAKKEWNI